MYEIFSWSDFIQIVIQTAYMYVLIFTSDRTLRSHFLYVCMSVRPSHNQIIRLNEKVNLIENLPTFELKTFGIEVLYAIHWANEISIREGFKKKLNQKVILIENLPRFDPRTFGIEVQHAIHWANGISISLYENLAI